MYSRATFFHEVNEILLGKRERVCETAVAVFTLGLLFSNLYSKH
jgi:hypothetical protein